MAVLTTLNNLCAPAYIYFVISAVFLILAIIFVSNGSLDTNVFCLDDACTKPGVAFMIVLKFVFIIFWTWILNFICKSGYPSAAWFLLLLPYFLLIITFLIIYELVRRSPVH
jgi:hypothetical protein